MYLKLFIFACGLATVSAILEAFQFESICELNQFQCKNTRCVSNSKICDGKNDCGDNTDELDCDRFLCRPPHYFKCKNDRCIPVAFRCDGEFDCEDAENSDELNCPKQEFKPVECRSDEWTCDDKHCIPDEWVCNGSPDCLDGSDETTGCKKVHKCHEFACKNNHCIPHSWVCDTFNDCSEGEDEQNCDLHVDPQNCTLENDRYLCPDNNKCLRLSQICDGKQDCADGTDESNACKVSSCLHHKCSHRCVLLPTGPTCLCPKGYHKIGEKQCEDINECETYGICDQRCRNTHGSYECYCDRNYKLQADKRTCKVAGGEAMLLYSAKTHIRGLYLETQQLFEVARDQKQVIGVAYNSPFVYWTNIHAEHESIVRALEDGNRKEYLVTSGLGAPEDLAIDWVTGNIYFTDSDMERIGVCTKDGEHCTSIVNRDIGSPRGIALDPDAGEMYWTDWGNRPEIAKSLMDGTKDMAFVSTNIVWPNGLAIDHPNDRLYWADAKMRTLESIRLDGTDRRTILEGIVRHPYGIAVFENQLYWSDWQTHSVQRCNKFTGKDHEVLIKDNESVYGVHIYHRAMKTNRTNSCSLSYCSDMCLLSGDTFSCACPEDKVLSSNRQSCQTVTKQQFLIAATKHHVMRIEHKLLGKHNVVQLPVRATDINSVAYSAINHTLFVSDVPSRSILSVSLSTEESRTLFKVYEPSEIYFITYDHLGNNLYYCDSGMATVNVLSLSTMEMRPLLHDLGGEVPKSIALVPDHGLMFVAFQKPGDVSHWHIDGFNLDGTNRVHAVDGDMEGPVYLHYDKDVNKLFWTNARDGYIECLNLTNNAHEILLAVGTFPLGISSLSRDLFWTNGGRAELMWADKNTVKAVKKVVLDIPSGDVEEISLIAADQSVIDKHACQFNNGNCSHICLAMNRMSMKCVCPIGMNLKADNRTCFKPAQCTTEEFYCKIDDKCVPSSMRCNGKKECHNGEDETDCNRRHPCPSGYFQCEESGECIKRENVCDLHYDCKDQSDEKFCKKHERDTCKQHQFKCGDGCIDESLVCDGKPECPNGEDEKDCDKRECGSDSFRCASGKCIPKDWECDRSFDCDDMSDEHVGCNFECRADKFKCSNGKCIASELRCDDHNDCGDDSDETNCQHKRRVCRKSEYSCYNSTLCVPMGAICNGTDECPMKDDERNCHACDVHQYECKNKKCVPFNWICDRTDDCGDNSDEDNDLCHGNYTSPDVLMWTPCDPTVSYRCKNGRCIDIHMVCNNNDDCNDGSDEGNLCNAACTTMNPCEQICLKTPTGPKCECKEGYRLRGDTTTCDDQQECSILPPKCSQKCSERIGTYQCSCFEGFLLSLDKKSCKSDGPSAITYFTVKDDVRSLSMVNDDLSVFYKSKDNYIFSYVDVAVRKNRLYFSVDQHDEHGYIQMVDTNKRVILTNIKIYGTPHMLAVDWITENIYIVYEHVDYEKVKVCNFHTLKCAVLFSMTRAYRIQSLAVDPVNKYIFYTMVKHFNLFDYESKIVRRTLDGQKEKQMQLWKGKNVTDIALDVNKKIVYLYEARLGQVITMTYDGKEDTLIFIDKFEWRNMQLFEDHLYFTTKSGNLTRCKLYDDKICEENVHRLHENVERFVIAQQSRQPYTVNQCENNKCSGICLATDRSFYCMCPNGDREIAGNGCEEQTEADHTFAPVEIEEEWSPGTKSSNTAVLVIFILLIFGAVIGAGFLYWWKYKNTGVFILNPFNRLNPSTTNEHLNPLYSNAELNDEVGTVTFLDEAASSTRSQPKTVKETNVDIFDEQKGDFHRVSESILKKSSPQPIVSFD